MELSWFSVAWAELDSDSDGMPDSFESQYSGEVMFEDHFDEFRQRYLFSQANGGLLAASEELVENDSDYLLGSHYQLDYLLNQMRKDNVLTFVPSVSAGASVFRDCG